MEAGVSVRGPGVCVLEPDPSPILTKASTALSTSPLAVLSTSEFRLLSLKPISRSIASFASKLFPTVVIFIPNIWLGLLSCFTPLGLVASRSPPLYEGDIGGVKFRSCFCPDKPELLDRKPKPNFLPGLGGKGGGSSLQLPVPVLPVLCLAAGAALPGMKALSSYFCRMYFSIAASASSASMGMSARTPFGFHFLLLSTLPICFMLST